MAYPGSRCISGFGMMTLYKYREMVLFRGRVYVFEIAYGDVTMSREIPQDDLWEDIWRYDCEMEATWWYNQHYDHFIVMDSDVTVLATKH